MSASVSESDTNNRSPQGKALVNALEQLNAEGQEKLLDYAADLVASGRYIKSDTSDLGEKEA